MEQSVPKNDDSSQVLVVLISDWAEYDVPTLSVFEDIKSQYFNLLQLLIHLHL